MPDDSYYMRQALAEARLAAEGLFRPEAKQPLPPMPSCVGVVTSGTGAALQDILQVIGRRWPLTRLLVAPVNVQGREAAAQIAGGIRALDADGRAQVIIVARGGGSREDLWVFNDEGIARAAFADDEHELTLADGKVYVFKRLVSVGVSHTDVFKDDIESSAFFFSR